jgi:hypothetical protein
VRLDHMGDPGLAGIAGRGRLHEAQLGRGLWHGISGMPSGKTAPWRGQRIFCLRCRGAAGKIRVTSLDLAAAPFPGAVCFWAPSSSSWFPARTVPFVAVRRNQLDDLILGALHEAICMRDPTRSASRASRSRCDPPPSQHGQPLENPGNLLVFQPAIILATLLMGPKNWPSTS